MGKTPWQGNKKVLTSRKSRRETIRAMSAVVVDCLISFSSYAGLCLCIYRVLASTHHTVVLGGEFEFV